MTNYFYNGKSNFICNKTCMETATLRENMNLLCSFHTPTKITQQIWDIWKPGVIGWNKQKISVQKLL